MVISHIRKFSIPLIRFCQAYADDFAVMRLGAANAKVGVAPR
ncbi:hypothetical protein [Shewanella dokdonensis]|nr:hypothetical protein [Shewanella dokdonensis]